MNVSIEVTGLITLVVGVVSALIAKREARKRETNAFFVKLVDQFNECINPTADADIEKALSLSSQICCYKTCRLITEKQFSVFEALLKHYLARKDVQQYLRNRMSELGEDEETSLYHSLLPYLPEDENEGDECDTNVDCKLLSQSDFTVPTMIIKVNRLYREGMSTDEVYEITRQWWRVSGKRAQMMKYALAVVHGIVKEVFEIDAWRRGDEKDECPGRWSFEGRVADEATRQQFVNKSVKALFKKGAMTPIRYFDGVQ